MRALIAGLAAITFTSSAPLPRAHGPNDRVQSVSSVPTSRVSWSSTVGRRGVPIANQLEGDVEKILGSKDVAGLVSVRVYAVDTAELRSAARVLESVASRHHTRAPAISLIPVLGFSDPSQAYALEATLAMTTEQNPFGVIFLAGLASGSGERVAKGLERIAQASSSTPSDIVRATCFYEDSTQVATTARELLAVFPGVMITFVRTRREHDGALVECEAVGRLRAPSTGGITYFNLPGTPANPNYSRATLVSASRLVYLGLVASASMDAFKSALDARVREAQAEHAELTDVVMATNFWADDAARDYVRQIRASHFGASVPAATGILSEALSPAGLTSAIELVVAIR